MRAAPAPVNVKPNLLVHASYDTDATVTDSLDLKLLATDSLQLGPSDSHLLDSQSPDSRLRRSAPRAYRVPTAPALRPPAHRRAGAAPMHRDRPGNQSAAFTANGTGPGRNVAGGTGSSQSRPDGQAVELPLAPVRVIRVGSPGVGHPLRPITDPIVPIAGDPTQVAATVVRAAVEVLDGRRSLNQIRSWLTPQVALQLAERTRLELAIPDREETAGPIRIRKVHLVRFGDRAEATVLIDTMHRTRAAAARLEARHGAWRVSVLEIA